MKRSAYVVLRYMKLYALIDKKKETMNIYTIINSGLTKAFIPSK